jgi:hypothetical protein
MNYELCFTLFPQMIKDKYPIICRIAVDKWYRQKITKHIYLKEKLVNVSCGRYFFFFLLAAFNLMNLFLLAGFPRK